MLIKKHFVMPVVVFSVCAFGHSAAAQDQRVTSHIMSNNRNNFVVTASGAIGSTAEEATRLAMQKGCEVARENGMPYYGVTELTASVESQRVQTQSGGTDLVLNQRGQAVSAVQRSAEHRRIQYGQAALHGTMMEQGGADMLAPAMQIVEARTCTVYSRPD